MIARSDYAPVTHIHDQFLERAGRRKGFAEAYAANEDEYRLVRELLAARMRAGLTQEQVAESMGTTKSAVSRLERGAKHSPSVATLRRLSGATSRSSLYPDVRRDETLPWRRNRAASVSPSPLRREIRGASLRVFR